MRLGCAVPREHADATWGMFQAKIASIARAARSGGAKTKVGAGTGTAENIADRKEKTASGGGDGLDVEEEERRAAARAKAKAAAKGDRDAAVAKRDVPAKGVVLSKSERQFKQRLHRAKVKLQLSGGGVVGAERGKNTADLAGGAQGQRAKRRKLRVEAESRTSIGMGAKSAHTDGMPRFKGVANKKSKLRHAGVLTQTSEFGA